MKLEPLSTNESLKDWFGKGPKGDWVRVGTDGKIKGDCAREPGEGKPKCMPRSKAHSMSKKDRATSARRKRRKDPVVDRPGTGNKPINVKTESVKPSGKATKPYSSHGIPKDATKAELKAIRSNPNSSKGKKQLAHWKLNMHKESITLGMTAAKALGPMAAKAIATKAAPYAAGAAAAYGATKLAKHKMKKKRDQKMINKAADAAVAKYKASQDHDAHKQQYDYEKDMQQGNDNRYNTVRKEGTYMGTFDKKAVDKYMSTKKKAPKPASDEYKKKLAKAYGIRKEAKDGITKKEKYMMTGRHLYDPKQGLQLEAPQDKGLSGSNRSKMDQLFRMGLIAKDERQLFLRALKRGSAALKDPLLRNKLYELLRSMMKIVTDDQQIYRQFRQYVQMNKRKGSGKGAFDVQEALVELNKELLNKSFEVINISEDMSGMSVSSGHKRSVAQGAGMTKKGVAAYRRRNPGSKLKTAVTTPPSKLKPGSKAAKRRKAFCSRSRSWTSDRGKAARRRWNC